MAVKLAASMRANVTVLSTSRGKEEDASHLGAKEFVVTSEPGALNALAGKFDLIIDTVSATHDLNKEITLLRNVGTLILVGAPKAMSARLPEKTPAMMAPTASTLIHARLAYSMSNPRLSNPAASVCAPPSLVFKF